MVREPRHSARSQFLIITTLIAPVVLIRLFDLEEAAANN